MRVVVKYHLNTIKMEEKQVKINFKKVNVVINFKGEKQEFDTTTFVGNTMKFSGSILMDIGFEKLAEEIYFSKDAVIIPSQYLGAVKQAILQSNMIACLKRELIQQIDK